MKPDTTRSARRIIACSVLAVLGGLTQTAQARECNLSSVAGQYGYTSSGSIVLPASGPFAAVGHVTLTRTATFTGAQTTSVFGNIFAETVNGTYEVNRDCTGSATVYVYRGTQLVRTSIINLVWDDNQREFRAIFTTTGTGITLNGRKMFSSDDEDDD